MAVFGMDIVSGLSGFGESEEFCGLYGSDLNNFCCMLRTLVAMVGVHVQGACSTRVYSDASSHRVNDVVAERFDSVSGFTGSVQQLSIIDNH